MKHYLELAKLNANHNRRQSRMTIVCIILAVFLVTSIFSMVDFEYMHMTEKMVKDHGNWHILLTNVSKDEIQEVCSEANVEEVCSYDALNYHLNEDYSFRGHPLCVVGTEPNFLEMIPETLLEGHFPEDDSEVLLNLNAKTVFGYSLGNQVVFNTPIGDFTYTVCGFVSDTSNSLAQDAMIGVMNRSAFENIADANNQSHEPQYYIRFSKSIHLKDDIAQLKTAHGWTEENLEENTAILGLLGMSTNNYVVGLYGVAGVLVALVVLAGVFMISGSMNANVSERTQFFGMLRCIGASKRQVRHIVRNEALNWLKLAIPVGIGISVLVCWVVCAILAYGIGGEWENMPVCKISFIGIGLGILVGIITVLLSARYPAKKASKVSPIQAVSGNQTAFSGKAARLSVAMETSLGVHHAVTKKKSLVLISGSFALSIVLFLMCSVMIDWIGNALTTIQSYTPQLCIFQHNNDAVLSHEFAEELRQVNGVKNVYGRMHILADVESDTGAKQIDLISYDELQLGWAKKDLLRGGNMEEVKDKIGSVMIVYDRHQPIKTGDSFFLNGKKLTVSAVLSDSPFSLSDIPTVICSEETFREYAGDMEYAVIDIQLEKGAGDETVAEIRTMIGGDFEFSDRRASVTETNSTYLAFTVLVYSFLGVVALISVLNIINSISMSVTARSREYGIMRAIGLDEHQLKKMIRAESMTFAFFSCLLGCILGFPLHAWFYKMAITNYWGVVWKFPIIEFCIIVVLVLCSSLIAVYSPFKRLQNKSITELMY